MYPKFTEVTLNSFIFLMDKFSKDPARKSAIIGIKDHDSSFCLLHLINEIQQVIASIINQDPVLFWLKFNVIGDGFSALSHKP